MPVTVTEYEPKGVDKDVVIVRVLVNCGLPDAGLKLHEAPEGSPPEQDKLTVCDCPLVKVTETVLEPDPPCTTSITPELETKKPNVAT